MRFVKQFNDPVSLTMPFREEPYQSDYLFPVFTNMLPEGANRKIVCRSWRMDEKDFFGLLLKIATYDTIGAITVKEVESEKNYIIAHPPLPSGLWEIRRAYRFEEEAYRNDSWLFFDEDVGSFKTALIASSFPMMPPISYLLANRINDWYFSLFSVLSLKYYFLIFQWSFWLKFVLFL